MTPQDWTALRVLRYLVKSRGWVRRRTVIRYVLFREPAPARDPILSTLADDDLLEARECLGKNGLQFLELRATKKGRARVRTLVEAGTLAA